MKNDYKSLNTLNKISTVLQELEICGVRRLRKILVANMANVWVVDTGVLYWLHRESKKNETLYSYVQLHFFTCKLSSNNDPTRP